MKLLKAIFYLHCFFMRKSQHYLNGDWREFTPFTLKQSLYQPVAYIKFMSLSICDVIKDPKYREYMATSLYR